ncbi:MAG: FAD-dependent oxidoreductase [Methanocellales archaeon]|nr:FAD-dependent oxidoreductase [Methanocellales archaeon]
MHGKKLLVPGETEFLGKGVSYCATCDGAFFKDKIVAVVGSEDEAAGEALLLADLVSRVILISNEKELEIAEIVRKRLVERMNVQILNASVEAIEGDTLVKAIKIIEFDGGEEREIPIDGIFISLGAVPLTQIMEKVGIELDERGCIKVDDHQRTNIEGVFAAGDCTCGGMQIVTAVGEGAMAAMAASVYIKGDWKEKLE